MKQFNNQFKTKLWLTIEEIENNSLVEIVVQVRNRSAAYIETAIGFATAVMILFFTLLMFLPTLFSDYIFYFGTLASFGISLVLMWYIPAFERIFIPAKRMKRQVEIMARALFQKGGIHHTMQKTGIFIYISVFEQTVFFVPDRGVENSLPVEEWDKIKADFNSIFAQSNPAEAFLEKLKNLVPVFNEYVPPVENDINELPDNLEINL